MINSFLTTISIVFYELALNIAEESASNSGKNMIDCAHIYPNEKPFLE